MRICAAADIHYPRGGEQWSASLAHEMCASGADVIVLAGDISAGPDERYHRLLGWFSDFPGPKLFVCGNHDLWQVDGRMDTQTRYHSDMRELVQKLGFHYLPGSPIVIDGVGFVGGTGWYDYSFRQTSPPVPNLRVTPMRVSPRRKQPDLVPINGRSDITWQDLTEDDYAGKALVWRINSEHNSLIWNDAVYTDWRAEDAAVARRLADEIAADATDVSSKADYLVGISHFVPWSELADESTSDVSAAYCRAYSGAAVLGEVFAGEPKFGLVLCGHHHRQRVIQVGSIVAANCSVGEQDAGPLVLTVPQGAKA